MPADFDKCIAEGGRIRTIKPRGKKSKTYIRVCYPKGGGSPISGGVKKREE